MQDNLAIYSEVRAVPVEAQKSFNNGRFSGTDINPMWRIKKLTELFGPCGFGWKYTINKLWLEPGADGVITSHAQIDLYVKVDEKWSEAIPGLGGNTFVSKTLKGFNTSDECYKMALTDALSIAAKALGVGADIYFATDKTKYSQVESQELTEKAEKPKTSNATFDWNMVGMN